MNKRFGWLVKAAAALAILAVVALAALSVALKRYLPPEKARELILAQSRKFLDREVKLQSVDIGVLSGLVLHGVEISERPDFKAGRFVSADSFQLKVKLLPLLHRSVVVDRLKATGVKVRVLRRKDGTFNFSDLTAVSTAAAASKPKAPSAPASIPFDLRISEAAVEEGEVSFTDESLGARVLLSGLNASAWNLGLSAPFEADVSLGINAQYGGKTYDAKLAWKGRANYADGKLSDMSASLKKFSVEYADISLSATGQVKNLEAPDMDLRAELGLKGVTMLEFHVANGHLSSLKLKPLPAPGGSGGKGPPSPEAGSVLRSPEGAGAGVPPRSRMASGLPDFKGNVEAVSKGFSTEGLQFLGVPKVKIPEAMIRVEGSYEGGDLKLDSLIVRLPPMLRMDGRGTMLKALSDKPEMSGEVTMTLDSPEFRLSDLPAEVQPYLKAVPAGLVVPALKVQGKMSLEGETASVSPTEIVTKFGKITVSGAARKPLSAKPEIEASVSMDLDIPEIKTADLPVALPASVPKGMVLPAAKVSGKAALKGDTLDLDGLRVATRLGEVSLTGAVRRLTGKMPEPDLSISLKVPETKLSDLPIALSTAIPAGLSIPPVEASGKVSFADDTARLAAFMVNVARLGKVTVSGNIARLTSGKPSADVEAKVDMRLSGLTTSDIPFPIPNLPQKVPIPEMSIEGGVKISGEDAVIDGLTVKAKDSSVTLKATAKKVLAGKLDPDFQLEGKIRLPAFKSADIPLPGVPAGLEVPATDLEFDLKGTPDVLRPSFFGVTMGKSVVKTVFRTDQNTPLHLLDPSKMDLRQWHFYMKVSTIQVTLDSIASISPLTKGFKPSGSFFGQISRIEGRLGALEIDKLKGTLVFQKAGAKVYGLDIADFSGEMDANEDQIRIYRFGGPKLEPLEGRVGGERFKLWVEAKDYLTKNPKVELNGEFGYLDLAKLLEAKAQFLAAKFSLKSSGAADAAKSTAAAVSTGKLDLKTSLIIRQLDHQNLNLNDIYFKTDLVDITPELDEITGTAELFVGMPVKIPGNESKVDSCATSGGKVNNLVQFLRSEPSLKALAQPVSSLNAIAALVPGLPGINTMDFLFVDNRYTFKKGVLTISGASPSYPKAYVCSAKTGAAIQGTVDLPAKTVEVWIGGGKGGKLGATVYASGPMDNPKTKVSLGGEACPKEHPYCLRQKAQ